MTRDQFRSNREMCRHLNDLLNDPVLMEAFSIAFNEGQPAAPDVAKGDLIQQAALSGSRTRGMNIFLNNLRSLTDPKAQPVDASGPDPDIIKQMVASGHYTQEQAEAFAKESISTQQNP